MAIKSTADAKSHLYEKGWIFPGEEITLEALARTLFAAVVDNKVAPSLANPILAVAYLITEKVEEHTTSNIASAINKHILDTLIPITTDIQSRLEYHLKAVTDLNNLHNDLTTKILSTQEKLDETNDKVTSTAKSYSQAATSPPTPGSTQPPSTTLSQLRICNREEIKSCQVLINFIRTPNLSLNNFNEPTLSRKALDSINTTWASSPEPKPPLPKLKSATLLRTGSLLLELNTPFTADWLRDEAHCDSFLTNLGSGANIRDRTYQVIAQFIPMQFDPEDDNHLCQLEIFNDLKPSSLLKREWIKPIKDRKPNQKVATMRMFLQDPSSVNKILKEDASILNRRIVPKKPKKEPIRCMHCQ